MGERRSLSWPIIDWLNFISSQVNRMNNQYTRNSGVFSVNQFELLKLIVGCIILIDNLWCIILIFWKIAKIVASEQRCIHSIDCLNAADELEKKMTKKEAQEFLVKLAAEKWLLNVSDWLGVSWETNDFYCRKMD